MGLFFNQQLMPQMGSTVPGMAAIPLDPNTQGAINAYAALPVQQAPKHGGGLGNILKSILGGALDGVAGYYGAEPGYSTSQANQRKLMQQIQELQYKAQIEDAQRRQANADKREYQSWEWQNKPQDPTEYARSLIEQGLQPGTPEFQTAMKQYNTSRADPSVTTTLPGDRFYSGPRSGLPTALGALPGAANNLDATPTVEEGHAYTPGPGGRANPSNWKPVGGGVVAGPGSFRAAPRLP